MTEGLLIGFATLFAGVGGFILGKSGNDAAAASTAAVEWGRPTLLSERNGGGYSANNYRTAAERAALMYNPETDLDDDLQTILRGSSPINKFASLTSMLSWLNPDNLDEVLKAYEDIPMDSEHLKEYQMLLYAWARFDKDAVLDYIDDRAPDESFLDSLLQPVLSSWASEDPAHALEFFEKYQRIIDDPNRQHQLQRSLIEGWAASDSAGATEYLQGQKASQNREYLIGELSAHMFQQGSDRAMEWAESLTDPKFKEQAWEELAEDWVTVDPKGLAAWLRSHTYYEHSWEAVEDLGRGWVTSDPDAATAWFESLPEGQAKQRGIHKMAQSWADNDLASLGEWLNSVPSSPTSDLGVQEYAKRLVDQAPQAAVESAMSISSDSRRNSTVQQLTQEWYSIDPDSATAWATESGYPVDSISQTNEVLSRLNAEQRTQIEKQLGQGNLTPEMASELQRTQELLSRQAKQLKSAPKVDQAPRG